MKFAITLLIGIITFVGTSQTDIIEYRSHNGSMSSYTIHSVKSIDGVTTNFGMMPIRQITTASLDTVKFLRDGTSVMVTSEYCITNQPQLIFDLDGSHIERGKQDNLWRAGSDTVLNHPLFSQQHSLDSIKLVLDAAYNFQNPIEEVVFIGYDNQNRVNWNKSELDKEEIRQTDPEQKENGGYGIGILIVILLPVFLVYISGPLLFGWMKHSWILC